MKNRLGLVLAIVLIATLSISASVLAAKNTSGTVTFDGVDENPSLRHWEENGIVVWTFDPMTVDDSGADLDSDFEIRVPTNSTGVNITLEGATFDLTSIDVDVLDAEGMIVSVTSAVPQLARNITLDGPNELNFLGVTAVRITGSGTNYIDNIVINGGTSGGGGNGGNGGNGGGGNDGNNGKKADKVTICHNNGENTVSGNAKNKHLAHGDEVCE